VELDPGADREHLHGGQTAFVNGIDVGGGFVHHSVALERKTVGFYDRNKNHFYSKFYKTIYSIICLKLSFLFPRKGSGGGGVFRGAHILLLYTFYGQEVYGNDVDSNNPSTKSTFPTVQVYYKLFLLYVDDFTFVNCIDVRDTFVFHSLHLER
jgi:hypothetical protein